MESADKTATHGVERIVDSLSKSVMLVEQAVREVNALDGETEKLEEQFSKRVAREIEQTERRIEEISILIEDPETELSTVIRKNVERAELESYLKGIRFASNGGSSK
jgi:hypothetical protein